MPGRWRDSGASGVRSTSSSGSGHWPRPRGSGASAVEYGSTVTRAPDKREPERRASVDGPNRPTPPRRRGSATRRRSPPRAFAWHGFEAADPATTNRTRRVDGSDPLFGSRLRGQGARGSARSSPPRSRHSRCPFGERRRARPPRRTRASRGRIMLEHVVENSPLPCVLYHCLAGKIAGPRPPPPRRPQRPRGRSTPVPRSGHYEPDGEKDMSTAVPARTPARAPHQIVVAGAPPDEPRRAHGVRAYHEEVAGGGRGASAAAIAGSISLPPAATSG